MISFKFRRQIAIEGPAPGDSLHRLTLPIECTFAVITLLTSNLLIPNTTLVLTNIDPIFSNILALSLGISGFSLLSFTLSLRLTYRVSPPFSSFIVLQVCLRTSTKVGNYFQLTKFK